MTVIPAIPGWRYALLDTEQGSDFYTAEIVAWWVNGHELEPFILDYLRTTVRLLNDRDDPVAILPPGEEIDGGHFDQAAVLWEIKRKEEERT